jgi:hypothetical protein
MTRVHPPTMLTNPEQGFSLIFEPLPAEAVYDFCGLHGIAGATCQSCSKPLLRILSLSANDSRLNVDPTITPAIHLLYCWTCSIPYGTFSYRIRRDGAVELLKLPPTNEYAFGPDGPYDEYTGVFPIKRVGLVALTKEEQRKQQKAQFDVDLALDLFPQKHQIGGFPVILNSQEVVCPVCSNAAPLFAAICDDASGNQPGDVQSSQSFTGNMNVQMVFHYCRGCSVVSAYHSVPKLGHIP